MFALLSFQNTISNQYFERLKPKISVDCLDNPFFPTIKKWTSNFKNLQN